MVARAIPLIARFFPEFGFDFDEFVVFVELDLDGRFGG